MSTYNVVWREFHGGAVKSRHRTWDGAVAAARKYQTATSCTCGCVGISIPESAEAPRGPDAYELLLAQRTHGGKRPGAGRPRAEDPRGVGISVRLTSAEGVAWVNAARAEGKSVSDWAREIVNRKLRRTPRRVVTE